MAFAEDEIIPGLFNIKIILSTKVFYVVCTAETLSSVTFSQVYS